jgi:hypothetical protein
MSLQSEFICSTQITLHYLNTISQCNDLYDILKEFYSFLISNVPLVIIRQMSGLLLVS